MKKERKKTVNEERKRRNINFFLNIYIYIYIYINTTGQRRKIGINYKKPFFGGGGAANL